MRTCRNRGPPVRVFQRGGPAAGMCGEGVNDAPELREVADLVNKCLTLIVLRVGLINDGRDGRCVSRRDHRFCSGA
jgi:hypothetical protein